MCFHKRLFSALDNDSCLRELHREPRTIFMEPHRNTFKLRIKSTLPRFYCELRIFKEELPV